MSCLHTTVRLPECWLLRFLERLYWRLDPKGAHEMMKRVACAYAIRNRKAEKGKAG